MKIPLSLLKSFLSLDLSVDAIAETLTLLGIEVDGIEQRYPPFGGVVSCEVRAVKPHPNAEKLQIAEVFDGTHCHQIVCGASNCRASIKTAFAKPGAWLPGNKGEKRIIETASVRGVESSGMLCSASELSLWEDQEGILELPADWPIGQDLAQSLWDPVFELSLTPNLGHALSALGIARELAAAINAPLCLPQSAISEQSNSRIDTQISVSVSAPTHCPRYMGRLIEKVAIGPSPFWLQKTLHSCGLKPISNVVDAVNYIMLLLGQPMHAFDFDRIAGRRIEIKTTQKEQKFLALDDIEREIPTDTLVIYDSEKPIAIAGIIGEKTSAVSETTQNIFLEAAFFDPSSIRKSAKKLGLRTESALRFEKGIDPNQIPYALDQAAELIATLTGGRILKGVVDVKKKEFPPKEIICRPGRVNQLLGTHLAQGEIEECLQRLQLKVAANPSGALHVRVPYYRFDISEEIDLIEEVARIYGYNNIEKKAARCIPSQIPHDPIYLFEKQFRQKAISLGLQEILTADLLSPKLAEVTREFAAAHLTLLKAMHAKTEEYSILRPSLLAGLMQVVKHNLDQKMSTLAGFEIGRIHFRQNDIPVEIPMGALILTGKTAPDHWRDKPKEVDFFHLKGLLETLFASLNIPHLICRPSQHLSFHPSRQADLCVEEAVIGSFGQLHPQITDKLDIKQRVYFAEINLIELMHRQLKKNTMKPLSSLPSSERDWTISLPPQDPISTLFTAIETSRPSLLERAELIDLYQPEGATHKNATLRFTYRDHLKTVSFAEVEAEHTALVEKVTKLLAK